MGTHFIDGWPCITSRGGTPCGKCVACEATKLKQLLKSAEADKKALEAALKDALKYGAPENTIAFVKHLKPCIHNPYWTTISGGCMACRATEAEAERDAMKAVVDKLPRTADGVPIVPGMKVWVWWDSGEFVSEWVEVLVHNTYLTNHEYVIDVGGSEFKPIECYSSREAAIAAKSGVAE